MAEVVPNDPQPAFHRGVVFQNVPAYADKEANAIETEVSSSNKGDLENVDVDHSTTVMGTVCSIWNPVYRILAHPWLGQRDCEENLESGPDRLPGMALVRIDSCGGGDPQVAQLAMNLHATPM